MKMKDALLNATPGKLSVEEVEIGDPGPGEVRVKIAASGLCHTDWEPMQDFQPVNLPAIIDHERAGVDDAVMTGYGGAHQAGVKRCIEWRYHCGGG